MTDRYESALDRQIREAAERGEFDNLPGAGRPLPGYGEGYREDWWLQDWVRREQISGLAPATLLLRRQVEELPGTVAKLRSEAAVRRHVEQLNERILLARRGHLDGPPVILRTIDIDQVLRRWRADTRSPDTRGEHAG
jgi:hypothetical protein